MVQEATNSTVGGGRAVECEVQCVSDSLVLTSEHCDSTVVLHDRDELSQEKLFTSEPDYLQLLGWRMVGHPAEWLLRMPYLTFQC